MTPIKAFLKEINSLTKNTKVVLDNAFLQAGMFDTFRILLKDDPFINTKDTSINVSPYFVEMVEKLVKKHFNRKALFNNTRSIFWFVI